MEERWWSRAWLSWQPTRRSCSKQQLNVSFPLRQKKCRIDYWLARTHWRQVESSKSASSPLGCSFRYRSGSYPSMKPWPFATSSTELLGSAYPQGKNISLSLFFMLPYTSKQSLISGYDRWLVTMGTVDEFLFPISLTWLLAGGKVVVFILLALVETIYQLI